MAKSIDNVNVTLSFDNATLDNTLTDVTLNTLTVENTDEPPKKRLKVTSTDVCVNKLTCEGDTPGTGQMLIDDGTAGQPGFGLRTDTDTGFFKKGTGSIGYSSYGAEILDFSNQGVTLANTKSLYVSGGDEATPSIRIDDSNTGFYAHTPGVNICTSINSDCVGIVDNSATPMQIFTPNTTATDVEVVANRVAGDAYGESGIRMSSNDEANVSRMYHDFQTGKLYIINTNGGNSTPHIECSTTSIESDKNVVLSRDGTATFVVENAAGKNMLTVDTTNEQVLFNKGTQAKPGIAIQGDSNTGFYQTISTELNVSCDNQTVFVFDPNLITSLRPVRIFNDDTACFTVEKSNGTNCVTVDTVEPAVILENDTRLRLSQRPAEPLLSTVGDMFYDSATNKIVFFNGTEWRSLNDSLHIW